MVTHGSYRSKYAAYRVDAQGADPILHPATGQIVGHKKPLVAEFGVLGDEQVIRDEEGIQIDTAADIRGFFWDSRSAQAQNGWTDEETQAVIDQVEYFCRNAEHGTVWRLEAPVLQAPWPTFDSQDDTEAVAFAIGSGMAEQALAYAKQQDRKKVVKELSAHLAEQQADTQAEQALTAV